MKNNNLKKELLDLKDQYKQLQEEYDELDLYCNNLLYENEHLQSEIKKYNDILLKNNLVEYLI